MQGVCARGATAETSAIIKASRRRGYRAMSAKKSSRVPDSRCDAVMLRPRFRDSAFVVVSACALVVLSSSPAAADAELL